MKIEFNKVTWYSKLAAAIVFVLTFLIAFWLGAQFGVLRGEEMGGWGSMATTSTSSASSSSGSMTQSQAASYTAPTTAGKTASQSQPSYITAVASYACSYGKTIDAQFYGLPNDDVVLTLSDGRTLTLLRAISADGARYANADQSEVFWNVGNTATLQETVAGKTSTTFAACVAKPVAGAPTVK